MEVLPSFLLIGAVKCGTTALAHYLHQHPDIRIADGKETGFFDSDMFLTKDVSWYSRQYFRSAQNSELLGDATPTYFYSPQLVVPRLREAVPNCEHKYILLLRDPVKRAWSHFLYMRRLGLETREFQVALEQEIEGGYVRDRCAYYSWGRYSKYLKKWFSEVGRENMLVLLTEDLQADSVGTTARAFGFLGVDADFIPHDFRRRNVARSARSPALARFLWNDKLRRIVKSVLPVRMRRRIRYVVDELNSMDRNGDCKIDFSIARRLYDLYEGDRQFLEATLGSGTTARWRTGSGPEN